MVWGSTHDMVFAFSSIVFPCVSVFCMESVDALITIDFREHDLIETFRDNGASGQLVKCLPLADVQCDYANGTGWLLERKTAFDFAASIRDGRFFEQRSRLTNATGFLVFLLLREICANQQCIRTCFRP